MNLQLSSWAIRRPIPTMLLFLLLAIAGWSAFVGLPINSNPRVDFPVVTVAITQPGAAPSELENAVTRRVEGAIAGMAGIRHVTSTLSEGVSLTTVEFQLGIDPDRATNDVRDAVSNVRADLPQNILEPLISRVDVEGGAILYYAISSTSRAPQELSWFVDDTVSRSLLATPGVQKVQRLGGVNREVRVELKPDRLEALGITADQVNAQIVQSNIDVPGGHTILKGQELAIRSLGSAASVAELAARPIALTDGRWSVLSDLASVTDGSGEARERARLNGSEVVGFSVFRSKGASDTVVASGVESAIAKLQKTYGDVQIQQIISLVDYTRASYKMSMMTLVEGAALTVLVVFFFLRNWRATLVAAIALPLSILPTFAVMAQLNYTLNSMTLLALTLVIGILVDDAIVEIENIERHLHMGKRPFQAAIDASDAIGFAVVAITATIVAVFLPVSFIGGYVGKYFTQFGITVSVAVLASLLVARLATPLLAAYLLQPSSSFKPGTDAQVRPGSLMGRYLAILEWALTHRGLALVSAGAFLAASLLMIPLLPTGFMPVSDQSLAQISIALPPGSQLKQTDARLQAITKEVRKHKEVAAVFATAGGQDGTSAGTLLVRLTPANKRDISQKAFEHTLRQTLSQFPDMRFSFKAEGDSRDVSIILLGADPEKLSQTAHALQKQMKGVPGISNVQVNEPLLRPELLIRPRPIEAARAGALPQSIGTVMRIATVGEIDASSARFNFADRQVPIRVALSTKTRSELETLRQLRVPTIDGQSIPLHSVADVNFGAGPARIDRFDRLRRISVDADLVAGTTLGTAQDRIGLLPVALSLPPGITRAEYGDTEYMNEMFTKFGLAMGFGVLMVYAVLVLLFKDFLQPITILTALPLSIGGALGGLLLYGAALDLPAVIGILMLMGIVTKNSILIVEFATEKRREGMIRFQALMQSGAERARPIVMTTIAMAAGMVPALLSSGADASFRAPMAVAVIGGLMTSTLLSLVFVPVIFTYMDDLRLWLAPKLARLTSVTDQDRKDADEHHLPGNEVTQ
ncbi:efflux RND transporter permease subunit [Janthinobacterium sp. GW458P]|uniref:efflux RND transporter permease subunit n=1 Tax=Janthinobacterium sp. GW458P TaxID=1981504 RepID=UPI000A321157|nr:efflux RND transporter permease subunit [Janthinobacterium sp. GW458P]MBE3025141.1 efflux RND transporter permease subunit [Janthinobacterium sp. GW458P]